MPAEAAAWFEEALGGTVTRHHEAFTGLHAGLFLVMVHGSCGAGSCWALQPGIHSLWVSEAETKPQLPAVLNGGLVL